MNVRDLQRLGPFGVVLDVGGNEGAFAIMAHQLWPDAQLVSFEPIPPIAAKNRLHSKGRWLVQTLAISDHKGTATLNVCTNQHSASTLQEPGSVRSSRFGIADLFQPIEVDTETLDGWGSNVPPGRVLLKIDVEGHERQVIDGAQRTLDQVDVVICEVQNDPDIFLDAAPPELIDALLREHGLYFSGLLDCVKDPHGRVVQFDGVWSR